MRCFLCKKNQFEQVYDLKTKNILRCKNDGLFLADAAASRRNNVYKADYFDNPPHPPKFNQSYFLKKLAAIKKLTLRLRSGQAKNNSLNILDIGCGWGDFEEVLEIEKITYLGIDVNKESIEICQKKGLNCKQLTIEKLIQTTESRRWKIDIEDGRLKVEKIQHLSSTFKILPSTLDHPSSKLFDVITMFQVIEHLKDPIPMLQTAKKLLTKNGIILITTPNNDSPLRKIFGQNWSVYNEPSHFVFYNKETLRKTLNLAGFKNIKVGLDSWRFLSLNYIINRLQQVFLPKYRLPITDNRFLSLPIPTDPFGDLETIGFKS